MSDRLMWVWLSLACGAGSRVYNKLFASFSTLFEIYDAPVERFLEIDGISSETAAALANKDTTEAERILSLCRSRGWGVLTYGDKAYPKRLKALEDPPVVLYLRGNLLHLDDEVCIAVVGTRSMTEYGEKQAYSLSFALAAGGAVVVSGMALGCDAMAANGALDAGAPTVAVLGCGIDIVYPRQHKKLADTIEKNGMIITEYPPGSPPMGEHFPVRNRIISGLSQGALIVEAPSRSGALITARKAAAQGRDIFAVPGEIGRESSEGCNELIKNGARAVTTAADVLSVYEFVYPHRINVEAAIMAEKIHSPEFGRKSAQRRMIGSRTSREDKRAAKRMKQETRELLTYDSREKKETREFSDGSQKAADTSYSFEAERRENEAPPGLDAEAVRAELSGNELIVFDAIGSGEITPDELTAQGLTLPDVMGALTMLELSGFVTAAPGGRYRRGK